MVMNMAPFLDTVSKLADSVKSFQQSIAGAKKSDGGLQAIKDTFSKMKMSDQFDKLIDVLSKRKHGGHAGVTLVMVEKLDKIVAVTEKAKEIQKECCGHKKGKEAQKMADCSCKGGSGADKKAQEVKVTLQGLNLSVVQEVKQAVKEFAKLPQEAVKLVQEFKKIPQEVVKVVGEFKKIPQEVVKVVSEFKKIPQEVVKVVGEFKKIPQEVVKVVSEFKKIPQEVVKVVGEFKKIPQEVVKLVKEFSKIPKEAVKLVKEFAKIPKEAVKSVKEFEKIPKAAVNAVKEFTKIPKEIVKAVKEFGKIPSEIRKIVKEVGKLAQDVKKLFSAFSFSKKAGEAKNLTKGLNLKQYTTEAKKFTKSLENITGPIKKLGSHMGEMGKIVGKFGGGLIKLGGQALMMGARMALGWIIGLGPVGIIIAAVVAIIALLVAAWKSNFGHIQEHTKAVVGWIVKHFTEMIDWFKSLPSKMLQLGSDIINGIWNGIKNMGSWLKEKVMSFASNMIPGVFKKVLGIASPSKVMMEHGKFVVQGVSLGMDNHSGLVKNSTTKLASQITGGFNKQTLAHSMQSTSRTAAAGGDVHIHVHPHPNQRAEEIADQVMKKLGASSRGMAMKMGSRVNIGAV